MVIDATDVTSVADLTPYDAVVMGDSGFLDGNQYEAAFLALLEDYHSLGGGMVVSSFATHFVSVDFSGITPIAGQTHFCNGPATLTIEATHPVTEGISSTYIDSSRQIETLVILTTDAEILASTACEKRDSEGAIVAGKSADGSRQVYLGSAYF